MFVIDQEFQRINLNQQHFFFVMIKDSRSRRDSKENDSSLDLLPTLLKPTF